MSETTKIKNEIEGALDKYSMNYTCSNCHRDFTEWFDFGERASQGTCPHCGVAPRRRGEIPYEY